MIPDYNWPTLQKLIGDARQNGACWVTQEGHVYLDCFTDVGASPIPNALLARWMNDGMQQGHYPRRPHAYYDQLRDGQYPELLQEHLNIDGIRVCYSNSGTEAVEAAIKLARRATGRSVVLGIVGDFHGRTLGALPLHYDVSGNQDHPHYHFSGFGPFNPDTFAVSDDNCYSVPTDNIAAFVISPIQGNNTLEDTPDWVWKFAADVRSRGGLIVFDEVQTGFGRGGGVVSVTESDQWTARAHAVKLRLGNRDDVFDVMMEPDIYIFGKACGAGWPMSLTVSRAELVDDVMTKGSHFNTMSGSPLGCYLSMRLIGELDDWLLDRMLQRSRELESRFIEIIQRGYMMAIAADDPYGFCHRAREAGLLLMTARPNKPVRLSPPFWMESHEERLLVNRLELLLTAEGR